MAVQMVVALLALASLAAASAPNCEDLVKPLILEDHAPIYGKWVYALGSTDHDFFQNALGTLKSSWIDLSATSDSKVVTLRWGDRIDDKCVLGSTNATISGTTSTVHIYLSEHKGQYLETCPDCLLWSDTSRNGDVIGRYLLLFTRTGKMDPTYLDTYKKKAQCLSFPEKYHIYDGETELCPDDKEAEKQADEKEAVKQADDKEAEKEADEKEAEKEADDKEAEIESDGKETVKQADDKEAETESDDKEAKAQSDGKESTTQTTGKQATEKQTTQ